MHRIFCTRRTEDTRLAGRFRRDPRIRSDIVVVRWRRTHKNRREAEIFLPTLGTQPSQKPVSADHPAFFSQVVKDQRTFNKRYISHEISF